MAKKTQPVEIKITGIQQAAAFNEVYTAKEKADAAKLDYDNARKGVMGTILSKIFGHWTKSGVKHTGAYEFQLPDGTTRTANVQNRQSSKSYDPKDAKDLLAKLNADTEPGAQFKASDVYNVVVDHALHPEAMRIAKVRDKILSMLTELESDLKKERTLPPEVSLILENKKLVLADHALDRILALSTNFEAAMQTIDNPVTANLVTK